MVDFNKRIYNSNKFREAAITFEQTGMYITAPEGTTEYMTYWQREMDRSLHGYTAEDGDYITGFHYFYLNYCQIQRMVDYVTKDGRKRKRRERGFPSFYDYDYFYFLSVEEAQEAGKHMAVLKSRRKGMSYKAGSMLCRNYYLIPESKGYVYASDTQFLLGDGIITKAWQFMDFIDEHTAWSKKRQVVDTKLHRRASISTTDRFGNKIEQGYKSEIIGASLKSDADKLRGKAGQLIFFEEAGNFDNLGAAWAIARPSVEQDGYTFGLMMAWGTGGSADADFRDLRDMFYNPEGYNCLGMPNIWDGNSEASTCGFFYPQYANLEDYMDEDGNTLEAEALEFLMKERKKVTDNASSSQMVDRFIAEHACTPAEASLQLSNNIFPKKELQTHLANIRNNTSLTNHKQVGDLTWDNGKLVWTIKKHGDITGYPLRKNDDPRGSIVIWEHPVQDAPRGLYIAGIDPYDADIAKSSDSLGSIFIYKRLQNFEEYYDLPVAEYTGRPETSEEFYENCRKLLTYYNAVALCENQNRGIFTYFMNKHCDYLLADQPDIIHDIMKRSSVMRKKGIHMTTAIKDTMLAWIKDWLVEEYAPEHKNLEKILSEPLLEELIMFNLKGNFDRVISFGLVIIFIHNLHRFTVKFDKNEKKTRSVIPEGLFSQKWFDTDAKFEYSNTLL